MTPTPSTVTAMTSAPPVAGPSATAIRRLDEMVERLRDSASRFAKLPIGDRIRLAHLMRVGYARVAQRQVRAACDAKGIVPGTPPEAEEWATGPWCVLRQLRLVAESLGALADGKNTPIGRLDRTA